MKIYSYPKKTQSFNGIRIVEANSEQIKYLCDKFPEFVKNNRLFKAESNFHLDFYETLKKESEKTGVSYSWLIKNAEIHGLIDKEKIAKSPLFVFTGKDKIKLELFSTFKYLTSIRTGIKSNLDSIREDFPEHLRGLKSIRDIADKYLPAFEKFLKRNNAKKENFDQLISEIEGKKL